MVLFSATAGADAEPGVSDVTYVELDLKPVQKGNRIKGKAKWRNLYHSLIHKRLWCAVTGKKSTTV